MSKSITKVSAVVLAIMTLLSSIFVVQADAATGDKVTIAFYYCFDSGGNAIRYQQTTSNNGYIVGSAGEELCRITANGEEAYCIEPGHLPVQAMLRKPSKTHGHRQKHRSRRSLTTWCSLLWI